MKLNNVMLDNALKYANSGLSVFPIKPRGKKPIYPGGYQIATTKEEQIREWWNKNPDANIGIATGKMSGGVFVLDVDINENEGINGCESLKEWEDSNNVKIPETVNSITGRGGYHYFFHSEREIKTRAGILSGIDVRGEGGYVVAPPSVHENGNTYEWEWDLDDYDISDANDAVYALLDIKNESNSNNHFDMPEVISEGGRNDKLFRMACSLQSQKYSDEAIRAMIEIENKQRCKPPLEDKELDRIISNALSYEKGATMYSLSLRGNVGDISIREVDAIKKSVQNNYPIYLCTNADDENALKNIGIKSFKIQDWKKEYSQYFIGCRLVSFLKNDADSKAYMKKISNDLRSMAFSIKIVETSKKAGGSVADYIQDEGHTKDDLMELISNTECMYATWVNVEGKKIKINAGLLADVLVANNNIIITRAPGFKSDMVYWYNKFGVYREKSDDEIMSEIIKYIPSAYQSVATLKNVVTLIKGRIKSISYDDLNNNERYINLKNGLIDTSSFELEQHDPRICGSMQLDCKWDPNAKADKWSSFVSDICRDEEGNVDKEMVNILQEWTGLFLSSVHGFRIKRALVLFSPQGNTGKSVFIGVLKSILGINNIVNVSFQEMGVSRWATGKAFGKRLIAVGDQSSESVENSSVFKQLTGGDLVAAEFKGIQGFDYVFKGMIVIACNQLPTFRDDNGDHIMERLMFLNCRNVIKPEKRDRHLLDALCQEKDGIFQWAMVGLKRFFANGYEFSECRSAKDLMFRYGKIKDTVDAFIQDECTYTRSNADIIRKTDFEKRYREYCSKKQIKALSNRDVHKEAESLGYPLYTKDGYKVYRCLKFNDDPAGNGFVPLDNDEMLDF